MRLRADTFTAGLALAFAAFIIQQGLELGLGRASNPGSGFILFWTGLIMAGLAATVLVQSLMARADPGGLRDNFADPGGLGDKFADLGGLGDNFAGTRWPKVLYVVALLAVYTALLEPLGFIVATFILLLVLFKTVEPQSWRVALMGAVLTTFSAWAVFVAWLGTQLPAGTLFMVD